MDYTAGQANRLGNRANNQDRCLLLEHEGRVLLAVADGMGGHARGELAAQAFAKGGFPVFLDHETRFRRNSSSNHRPATPSARSRRCAA